MLIKGIDFPEKLLRAQMTGDLVIFAGAGVSCPAPSSLPTFRDLAKQVGSNSGVEQMENEPEDRYLGRLGESGVRVHEAVARILTHPQSQPNDLHRLLLKIATTKTNVRLGTVYRGQSTNLDRFSSGLGYASGRRFTGCQDLLTDPDSELSRHARRLCTYV